MLLTHRFNHLLVLLAFAICVPAVAAAQDQTQPNPHIVTAKIKLDELSMIIVPVSINGSGPYDFLLDTGSAKSMVDQKLADELGLPRVGEKTIVGVLASAKTSVVNVNSFSIAGAAIAGGDVFCTEHPPTIAGKVRGVVGEDFLRNFDVLVDYRHQLIELESVTDSLAKAFSGEHLPLQLDGMYQGQPTHNRLIVTGSIPELSGKPMTLLLDSGANHMVLFRDSLGAGEGRMEPIRAGGFGSWAASETATRTFRTVSLGSSSVPDLTVVGLFRRPYVDVDGLLPTSVFHSIFISHREGFVILNPSLPKPSR
jgi:predicted aspartyl protease